MKILFSVLMVVVATLTGVAISSSLKKKKSFYDDLCQIIKLLIRNLNFEKQSVENVLNSAALGGLEIGDTKSLYFLTDEERFEYSSFISSLGRSDTLAEKLFLSSSLRKFEDRLVKAKESFDKNSPMTIKLSVLLGVAVVIFFI